MPSEKLLNEAKDYAVQKTLFDLLGAGVDSAFVQPVVDQFRNIINVGGTYENLVDELRLLIEGNDERLGVLERYTKQVNKDAVSQFNSNYNKILTKDLGLQFAQYVGGRKKDTREFCIKYRQQFFHNEEVRLLGEGVDPITGNKLTGSLLQGRIPMTDGSSIWTYRGGYNCEHFFVGVETIFVPKNVVLRAIEKGYYTPSNAVKQHFGI